MSLAPCLVVLLGGVIERAWEYFLEDATFDWAFGPTRNAVLGAFVLTGVITYVAVLAIVRRDRASHLTRS